MKRTLLSVSISFLLSTHCFAAETDNTEVISISLTTLPHEIQKEIMSAVEDYKTIKKIALSNKSLDSLINDMKVQRKLNPMVLWAFQDIIRKRQFTSPFLGGNSVAFDRDHRLKIEGTYSGARIVDATTGDIIQTLPRHGGLVVCVALSLDGQIALTGSTDRTAKVWNVLTGELIRTLVGHTATISSLAVSSDDQMVITGSQDHTVKMWHLATGNLLQTLQDSDTVLCVALSPDNKIAITGLDDCTAKIWNLTTGQIIQILTGHTSRVYSVALSPDKKVAVSGSADRTAKIWNVATGELIQTLITTNPRMKIGLNRDKTKIITHSADGNSFVWDIEKGENQ